MIFGNGKSPDVPDTQEETDIDDEWNRYIQEQREADLQAIIAEEKLKPEETRKFMAQSFTDGYVTSTGVAITKVLPPMPIFGGGAANRENKKRTVLEKLTIFFNKYLNIGGSMSEQQKDHVVYDLNISSNYCGMAAENEVKYQRKH